MSSDNAFPTHCAVRGCTSRPEEFFELAAHPFSVCHLHGLFLRAGEDHTAAKGEILLGSDSATELIRARPQMTLSGQVLVLELGHHGVVDSETFIRLTPSTREALHLLLDQAEDPEPT